MLITNGNNGFIPEPHYLVSDWSDKHRLLSGKSSAEPGQWKTARTPYLKEVMDELSTSSPTQRIVFMKGAQVGGTECGNNWIGYVIHIAPGPMMAVSPTVDLAKRNSKQRIRTRRGKCLWIGSYVRLQMEKIGGILGR